MEKCIDADMREEPTGRFDTPEKLIKELTEIGEALDFQLVVARATNTSSVSINVEQAKVLLVLCGAVTQHLGGEWKIC